MAVAVAMAMAIIINENNTIQFNFPDSVKVDPLYEFNSLPGDYSPIDVIMKYSHKGFHTKFKLFYKDGVLTLELYLPKPTGHCFEHNFLVASLDVTSISGDNYPLTDEVIFFGFQDIEYERVYDGIIRYTNYRSPPKDSSDNEAEEYYERSDYEMCCYILRDLHIPDRLLDLTDYTEIDEWFSDLREYDEIDDWYICRCEDNEGKYELTDKPSYKLLKRIFKTLRLNFDKTKIISGYRLYNYSPDEIKFWQFFMLKAGYDSKEIMSYSDFRAEYYEIMDCRSGSQEDEDGKFFGGFWDSTNETLYDDAYHLQWEHNCKKLYQLPYPHKLLLLSVNFEGASLKQSVRYSNFICYMVETLDNIMIKQYFEALEAIKYY